MAPSSGEDEFVLPNREFVGQLYLQIIRGSIIRHVERFITKAFCKVSLNTWPMIGIPHDKLMSVETVNLRVSTVSQRTI